MKRLISPTSAAILAFAACLALFATPAPATEPPITALAIAPNGKSVLAASQSGLHVYRWPDLSRQKTIETSAANLHCLAFSDSEEQLAVGGGNPSEDGIVEIFAWPSGKRVRELNKHFDCVLSVAWSDGGLFTASMDRDIKRLNVTRGTQQGTLKGHSRGVAAVCLLPDKKFLVSGGADQSLRVWETDTGKLVRSLSQHTGAVAALAVRPSQDGLPMVASAADDHTIRFWQPTIGRMVRYIRLASQPLAIAWLDEDRIAAACVDGNVRIIDAGAVKELQTIQAIDGWAYAIAVHPADRTIVVGGTGGQLVKLTPAP